MSERIVNSQIKEIADRDIEPLLFIYENECPVEIQIWDQVDPNFKYYCSQNYLQNKNGVLLIVNPAQPTNKIA